MFDTLIFPMSPPPRITVAICTHNRAGYLAKALDSMRAQTAPPDDFEVVVVDNASTDTTASMVENVRAKIPTLRYVFEGKLGLSHARNRALHEARAEYIAFLDDDAIASPEWVDALLGAFETMQPRPACVGGRIDPIWEGPRPAWLAESLMGYLTVIDWSDTPLVLDPRRQYIAGANMAFITSVLRELGGFHPALGRVGEKLLSGEELYVQNRLSRAGHRLYYDPRAAVGHHVPAARLTRHWFLDRAYSEGLSAAVIHSELEKLPKHRRVRMAVRLLGTFALHPGQWALRSRGNEAEDFSRQCQARRRMGMIWGLLTYSALPA